MLVYLSIIMKKFVESIYSNLASTSVGVETDIDNLENFSQTTQEFLEEQNNEVNFRFGAIADNLNNILTKKLMHQSK